MIHAILWDNDGVLVDTEHLFYQVNREVFAELGVGLELSQFIDWSLGQGRSLFELLPEPLREQEPALRARRNLLYQGRLRAGVDVFAGAEDCLKSLRDHYRMAIVTSSNAEHFHAAHEQSGLLEYFDFALKNGDYERHKPHPEPYLLAAERLGVDPQNCIVVEDTERGLESACRAGMRCIAIPNPLYRKGAFERAAAVVRSIREVPAAIASLSESRPPR